MGGRSRLYRTAKDAIMKSGQWAYRDRRVKKREFRALWITRINAAVRKEGISYSQFINGLTKAKVELNRKSLSEMAIHQPEVFQEIVAIAKSNI